MSCCSAIRSIRPFRASSPVASSVKLPLLWVAIVFSIASLLSTAASAQVVAQYDFEDGTTQGWTGFCGATLTNTTAAAESGTHSVLASGRNSGCAGPSLDVTSLLLPGATYQISGWVELTSSNVNTDQANFTIKQVDGSGTTYNTVGAYQTPVTNSAWTHLTGQFTVSTTATNLLLYSQLVNSTTDDFYLDNVTITEISPPPGGPQDNSGISTNFEDGTLEGWSSRAGCALTNTTADAHSGTHSLLITGRTHAYDGPQISVNNKMYNGSTYAVSVWVKLGPTATAADTIRVSLQTTLAGTTTFHTVVGNTSVPLGTWVKLTVPNYAMAFAYDPGKAFLYVESNSGTQDFYIDDFTLTFIPPIQIEQNIPSVYQTYAEYFPIGAAIYAADLTGPHSQLLKKHFNSITSENDMKWDATEPQEGTFSFANADAQVAFAQANNIRVRGHNLVWSSQIPSWVFLESDGITPMQAGNAADKQLLTQRMQNHIQNVVTHFGSAVYAWDVVNEPIDPSQPDCLQHNQWYNIIGPDYIDTAFQFAHQANPNAELFVNDYNSTTSKRACLYQVVQGLLARGVPINAVGHEMHSNLQYPPVQTLIDTVNQFAALGIDQQVTELDISVYAGANPTIYTQYSQIPNDLLVQQGYLYRDFFQALKQLKGKISSVTLWGMADDHTWLTSSSKVDAPLLFDTQLQHKYAYTGIIDPLNLPGANLVLTMTPSATTVLSGHSVSYVVTAANNGPNDAANLILTDALPPATVFQSISAPAGWTCTSLAVGSAGTVTCTAATLTNGATAQFTLTLTVLCATPNGTSIVNAATVTSTTLNPNPTPENSASASIGVSDPPPVISGLAISSPTLWPPNHMMIPETLSYSVATTCDPNPALTLAVTSNQADADSSPDWIIDDPHHLLLEAERSAPQSRIYTITVTATDSAGASSSGSLNVQVPLSQ